MTDSALRFSLGPTASIPRRFDDQGRGRALRQRVGPTGWMTAYVRSHPPRGLSMA